MDKEAQKYKYLTKKNIDKCLRYIDKYWKKVIVIHQEEKKIRLPKTFNKPREGKIIPVPYPFISPNHIIFKGLMFYWDSYFSVAGFLAEKRYDFAKNIAENCFSLIERFGFVPYINRTDHLTRSQPPFLSSLVKNIYICSKDKGWLKKSKGFIEKEYKYWTTEAHLTKTGLSKYHDKSGKNAGAELESGWDFTPRFLNKANNFCPIDLNSQLYKYELDLSEFCKIIGNKKESAKWVKKAKQRKDLINRYLWNPEDGMFYDYDFKHKKQSYVRSVAAYVALWARLATKQQAKSLVKNLKAFEFSGGLSCCPQTYGSIKKQWGYPNGWAPGQLLAIRGLRKYGYYKSAERIAKKWLDLNIELFLKTKKMWEKYDVVDRKIGNDGVYKTQSGFGWTNAVFLALVKHELKKMK
ncbi:MAG TPA: hypothetical protein ENG87_01110 [Candidatus Pacearchaeota archaeon]|nr:cytoplasmic trehalase [archaeon BMS3Abin17]HDK41949.1 hypothetical protein [Candidatus Pacearchaeota archaeon]HDZ60131.1 hypothetical protein [Candidatus Pacearchaeota archaeon]